MSTRTLAAALLAVILFISFPWRTGAETRATLRWGSRGSDVCLAQRRLKAWGYYKGEVDCIFGRLTHEAVTLFQRRNGLTVDGIVGPDTWAALGYWGGPPSTVAAAAAGTQEADRDLLARVVSAEARGEPYEGQVAVAAVILNRVRDSRFPNTIAGVVYQTHAFESVSNGTVYAPPADSAVRAAQDALNGWDPSGGALFFWNPAKATSQWVWSRPIIKQIGNHVFAK